MWGTGSSFQAQNSVFVGTQWTNKSGGVGGIVGSVTDKTVYTNPAWWAWKACKDTINFLCGSQPSKGAKKVIVDTRTGARVDLTTSGKFGLDFGYTVDSGSVGANVQFSANAALPQNTPKKLQYFNLKPSSSLDAGSINSRSPNAQAYMNAIAQLSGSVTAQACLITQGCTPKGSTSLPGVKIDQPILSIDPNSLKVVPGLLPPASPGGPRQALAETKLANQTLTLEGALSATGEPGFKLTTSQFTIATNEPPAPAITTDLANLTFQLPVVNTNGGLNNGVISSSGSNDFLDANVDLGGVATMGGFPPTQIGLDLIDAGGFKVSAKFYALDVLAGPSLGLTQNFELKPTLMVHIDFSRPVKIAGESGLQTYWEGAWSKLPDIALLGATTFTPTYWIDAGLTNNTGLDLNLIGTMDLLKFNFTASAGGVNILSTNPVSLNSLLGLNNQLFSTPSLNFPVWNNTFQLGGFNTIAGTPFTIGVTSAVPEPGTFFLLIAGLGCVILLRSRGRRHGVGAALN